MPAERGEEFLDLTAEELDSRRMSSLGENYLAQRSVCEEKAVLVREEFNRLVNARKGLGVV